MFKSGLSMSSVGLCNILSVNSLDTCLHFASVCGWCWPTVTSLTVHISFSQKSTGCCQKDGPSGDTCEGCDCVRLSVFQSLSASLHRVVHVPDRIRPRGHIWRPHVLGPWVDWRQDPNSSGGHFTQRWDCWINPAACQSFLITKTA